MGRASYSPKLQPVGDVADEMPSAKRNAKITIFCEPEGEFTSW
jgi:hypothetical protein